MYNHRFPPLKAVIFDLDHTLWDMERNASETLAELFLQFQFGKYTLGSAHDFVALYKLHNQHLWQDYERGLVSKQELRTLRFDRALDDLGVPSNVRPSDLWSHFLQACPEQTHLMPHARSVLTFAAAHCKVGLVSNGFDATQRRKLVHSQLESFFDVVVISEKLGFSKPNPAIFQHACRLLQVDPSEAVMIGDHLDYDIKGALDAGLRAIWFNPEGVEATWEVPIQVRSLEEVPKLLASELG